MFTGQDWWLAALLVGYIVVVPLVSMLYEENEDDVHEHDADSASAPTDASAGPAHATNQKDALDTLRQRYARGELTDDQFERKLERLLETETVEDVEDRLQADERTTLKE